MLLSIQFISNLWTSYFLLYWLTLPDELIYSNIDKIPIYISHFDDPNFWEHIFNNAEAELERRANANKCFFIGQGRTLAQMYESGRWIFPLMPLVPGDVTWSRYQLLANALCLLAKYLIESRDKPCRAFSHRRNWWELTPGWPKTFALYFVERNTVGTGIMSWTDLRNPRLFHTDPAGLLRARLICILANLSQRNKRRSSATKWQFAEIEIL